MFGAVTGLAIVLRNATGNNYHMDKKNKTFEVVFFTIIVVMEALAVISYLCLWKKQRNLQDLTSVNKFDFKLTCGLTFARLFWAIGLSFFVLSRITIGEKAAAGPGVGVGSGRDEWDAIYAVTCIIMIFEIAQVVGFILLICHQPQDYVRERDFDNIGGVLSEVQALERLDQKRKENKLREQKRK